MVIPFGLVPTYQLTTVTHHLCLYLPTYLPTYNWYLLLTTYAWYLPTYPSTNGPYHLCLVPTNQPTNVTSTTSAWYLPTYLPMVPITCAWYLPIYLPPVLGTLLPSYLPPYLPNVPTYQPPTWVRSRHREREREREGWSSFLHAKKLSWLLLAILCTQLQPSAQVLLQQQELVCECMYAVAGSVAAAVAASAICRCCAVYCFS